MMPEATRLAHMATQVASAFHAQPEAQAAQSVAAHINQFWAPSMRRLFLARAPALDLPPVVRRALPLIRPPAQ